ncbi:GNAT family N-acetyltransferase [Nocardioides marmoraquaticus]
MGVVVRRAVPDDLDAVAALEREGLGPDAWSEVLLREGLGGRLPTTTYLVAERDGVVVGHAVSAVAGDVVELQRIAVVEPQRRTGLASALLEAVVALAGPGERVLLEVREDNVGAQAFYAARGFVELARRPRYYAGGATAVVLELRP